MSERIENPRAVVVMRISHDACQQITDQWEVPEGADPSWDQVLEVVWSWPDACISGKVNAVASILEAPAGRWCQPWVWYMAYVSENFGQCLGRAASAVGATRKAPQVNTRPGDWIKIGDNDPTPELVVEDYILDRPGENSFRTMYWSNSGSFPVLATRQKDNLQLRQAEPPEWFRGWDE